MDTKGKRLRFNPDDDLALLREVVNLNPLGNNENWTAVQENLEKITGKRFIIRTIKDHLQLLLELFNKKEDENKIK